MKLLTKIWILYCSVICQKPGRHIGRSKHFIPGLSWWIHKKVTSSYLRSSGRLLCYLEGPQGTDLWLVECLAVQNIISFQLMGGRCIYIVLNIKDLLFFSPIPMIWGERPYRNALRERVVFNWSAKGTKQGSENQSPEVFTSQPNSPFPKQLD